jgi:NAD(P)-dependent dehydrogenase (short-subunit alcohol dehydrogenase family)
MNDSQPPASGLAGQRIVVIGASSGIGLALSRQAAAAGAHVVMSSRSPSRLAAAAETVVAAPAGTVTMEPADSLDEDAVEQLFSRVGEFDHLVVTAVADETKLMGRLVDQTTQTARRGMEKFWTSYFTSRAAARRIRPSGSITLTASAAIFNPPRDGGASVMNAASGAVAVLGRSLAAELAPVRVNVIAPGVVNSGVWDDAGRQSLLTGGAACLLGTSAAQRSWPLPTCP